MTTSTEGGLEAALHDALDTRSADVVDVSRTAQATYSTDASNYRHIPLAVVGPRSEDDVLAVLRVARELRAPVLPRGQGRASAARRRTGRSSWTSPATWTRWCGSTHRSDGIRGTGVGARPAAPCGLAARAHLRPGSVLAQPVHAGPG